MTDTPLSKFDAASEEAVALAHAIQAACRGHSAAAAYMAFGMVIAASIPAAGQKPTLGEALAFVREVAEAELSRRTMQS